jgi:beta-lactamase class A
MNRRDFQLHLAGALALGLPTAALTHAKNLGPLPPWAGLEKRSGGRLGVAVLRADGQAEGHRLDERFPMCSTFKWLAAAHVLQRVDAGQERLDRRIVFGADALKHHSPITSQRVGGEGMTLAELCHATITVSDNAAGNLILASFGGPAGLTRFARGLGDAVTRLDRWEPELNEARPGDPRDTTSPRAMARLLQTLVLGPALSPASREQLAGWLEATETNGQRLKAELPAGWRLGSKTGTGARGTTNDVGIFWPPGKPPVVVAVYLTETGAGEAVRNGTVAAVARFVTGPSRPV